MLEIDWEAVIRTLISAGILGIVGYMCKLFKGAISKLNLIFEKQNTHELYIKEDIKETISKHYHNAIKQGYITCNDLEICDKKASIYLDRLEGNSFVKQRMDELHSNQIKKKDI